MTSNDWKSQLAEMVPAYGISLAEDTKAYAELGEKAAGLLKLQ
jgi:hypothetical protein